MRRHEHRPMTEGVVIGVLRYMRAEIIRDGLDGLEHADALLRARGVDPEALYVPRKQPKHFRRGALRMAILRALQDGPRTSAQITAAATVGHGLATREARKLVYRGLCHLRAQGIVCAPSRDVRGRLLWSYLAKSLTNDSEVRASSMTCAQWNVVLPST